MVVGEVYGATRSTYELSNRHGKQDEIAHGQREINADARYGDPGRHEQRAELRYTYTTHEQPQNNTQKNKNTNDKQHEKKNRKEKTT